MKRKLFSVLAVCGLSLAWSQGTQAAPRAEKYLMASMGDSITSGTFANLPIRAGDAQALEALEKEQSAFEALREGRPETLFMFLARLFLQTIHTYSWSSGAKIDSQYVLLREYLKRVRPRVELDVYNAAIPGGMTYQMPLEAERIAKRVRSGKYGALKYVTYLVGANDVCSEETPQGTPREVMRENLLASFEILSRIPQSEPIRVVMSAIPRIPDLAQEEFRSTPTLFGFTCEALRSVVLKSCRPLLEWKTRGDYLRSIGLIEDRNRVLREVAREVSERYPNIHVFFTDHLYRTKIKVQDLAVDCFHPNFLAQEALSKELWELQPWYR